jgi:conjugative relaxase-like TrwC/TraI family protein
VRSYRPVKASNIEQVKYYTEDESLKKSGYYSSPEAASESEIATSAVWMGTQAKAEHLKGFVEQSGLETLMEEGVLPKTGERIRGFKKSGREQLAFDLTLSAPKSFSMHAVKDFRLFEAQMRAVERTLAEVEKRYSIARVGSNRVPVVAGSLIAAAIPHWTSREMDMQLHTHLLIMNGVLCPDGKWRALDDRQLSRAEWLGSFYRNELAKETQALGYTIEETALENGFSFEIKGPTKAQRDEFSKRSHQITEAVAALEAKLEEQGIDATVTRNDVVELNRKPKKIDQTWEELRIGWINQLQGVPLQIPKGEGVPRFGYGSAAEELDSAIRHFSERSVSFSRDDLYKYALDHIQGFDLEVYDQCIEDHLSLITLNSGMFSTAELLQQEIGILESWKAQCLQGVAPLAQTVDLSGVTLNPGQMEAVTRTLQNSIRHQIIQGFSGAGKTTALRQIAEHSNLPVFGFAPTIKAALELEKSLEIPTKTVESLVLGGSEPGLWIIDESGLKSARQMFQVLQLAEKTGSRILLVGDTGQNSSVEAGSPMASLMLNGAATHSLKEIIRQQNKEQKRAVELLAGGRGKDAIALLYEHDYIQEKTNSRVRARNVAKAYMAKLEQYPSSRKIIVVTGTNAERIRVTNELRKALKEAKVLGDSVDAVQLNNRGLTREQARQARNYRRGDYIRLGYVPRSSALSKGVDYKVVEVLERTLKIQSPGGRRYEINPAKVGRLQVYYTREVDFAVGDRVLFRATDNKRGYSNGQELEISKIKGTTITGVDRHGIEHHIDVSVPVPLDHAWAGTSYKWQGSTAYEAIVSLTSDPTSSRNPVYVSVSRQTHVLQIFTEDYDQLLQWAGVDNRQPNIGEDLSHDFEYRNPRIFSDDDVRWLRNAAFTPDPEPDAPESGTATEVGQQGLDSGDESGTDTSSITAALSKLRGDFERPDQPAALRCLREAVEQGKAQRVEFGGNFTAPHRDGQTRYGGSPNEPRSYPGEWRRHRGEPDGDSLSRKVDQAGDQFIGEKITRSIAAPLAKLAQALDALNAAKASLKMAKEEVKERVDKAVREARVSVLGRALQEWQAANSLPAEPQIDLAPLKRVRADDVVSFSMAQLGDVMREKVRPPAPKKYVPFWVPNYEGVERPPNICDRHWREMQNSCIHPDLIEANISTMGGMEVYDRLIGEKLSGMGAGQHVIAPQKRLMLDYRLPAKGGWWGMAGVNPHTFEQSLWGCFKPDYPRLDQQKLKEKGKEEYIKYEHPLGPPRELYLANIPDRLAKRIFDKHGVTQQPGENFWQTVIREELPIVVIEGLKKTLASLSQGHITVGVSGVNALYRAKDEKKEKLPLRELNPDFLPFCTQGRSITFAYDEDTKLSAVLNVRRDMVRSIERIEPLGPEVAIAKWSPEQGKGADDLIAQSGTLAFDRAIQEARPSDSSIKSHYRKEYNRLSKFVNQQYGGLSPEQLDVAVYIEAVNRGDNRDGDRVLMQSDQARTLSEKGHEYPEHIKGLAFSQYQLNKQAAQIGRELVRRYGHKGRWAVDRFQFVDNHSHFKIIKDNKPILNYNTDLERVSGIVNQSQVEAMQKAISRHQDLSTVQTNQKQRDRSVTLEIDS